MPLPRLRGAWRSLDEVIRLFPDVHVEGKLHPLFNTLFPQVKGLIDCAV